MILGCSKLVPEWFPRGSQWFASGSQVVPKWFPSGAQWWFLGHLGATLGHLGAILDTLGPSLRQAAVQGQKY